MYFIIWHAACSYQDAANRNDRRKVRKSCEQLPRVRRLRAAKRLPPLAALFFARQEGAPFALAQTASIRS